jgi:hypothetical protein
MVSYLESQPAKAAAWASTLGIQTSQIKQYVDGLTSVVLRTDTRVTNHGYVGGTANPIQSVLESGTAVFVDKYGAPVVKCYCGNPLTPPVTYTSPTYTGPVWANFQTTHITIINQSTTIIKIFTLYDPATGQTFTRPAGPGASHDGPFMNGTSQSSSSSSTQTQTGGSVTAGQENPSASISPNPGVQGDNFTVSVSGFRPGAQLQLTMTRPDGGQDNPISLTAGGSGSASYTYSGTSNVLTGPYSAVIRNPATGASASASVQVNPASSSTSTSTSTSTNTITDTFTGTASDSNSTTSTASTP